MRAEDYQQVVRFDRATDTADDLVLDIPTNVIKEFEGRHERLSGPKPVRFVMNLSLGTLDEQLHRASSVTE